MSYELLRSSNFILKGKFVLIIYLFFIGCVKENKDLDVKNITELHQYTDDDLNKITEIYFKDQFLRRATYVLEEIDKIKVVSKTEKRNYYNDLAQIRSAINKCYRVKQDGDNIIELLEIIKDKPYPSVKDSILDVPVFIIFMHTPDELKTSVRNYITDQYNKGNLKKFENEKIMWHLNGREWDSFPSAEAGIRYYTDKQVFEYFEDFNNCD
jgi:hypothetical protein